MTTKSVSSSKTRSAPSASKTSRRSGPRKAGPSTVSRMKGKIGSAKAGNRKDKALLDRLGKTDPVRSQRLAAVLNGDRPARATKLADQPDATVQLAKGKKADEAWARDPSLKPITDEMLKRLSKSKAFVGGETPKSMFEKYILNNRNIPDDMIRKMNNVPLSKLADSPADSKRALERIPNVRETKNHKFTVDLLAGITGHDPAALSKAAPALGMTGTPSTVFWNPQTPPVQRFTALHDATSYLKDAGVPGLNQKMWGVDNNVASAVLGFPISESLLHEADVARIMREHDPKGANFIRRNLEEGSEGQLRILKRLFGGE